METNSPVPHHKSRLSLLNLTKKRRPIISGPIGPIKNSRGPDFIRSNTFTIVPRIKDCGSDESLLKNIPINKKAARRISASFPNQGTLTACPTVAKSDFNATTVCQVDGDAKTFGPLRQISTGANIMPKGVLTSSSSSILLSHVVTVQDENLPPMDTSVPISSTFTSKPTTKSKLPKSRTMSVLQDLKTSISRPSFSARSSNSNVASIRKTSKSSTITTAGPLNSSRTCFPQTSTTSLPQSKDSSTPDQSRRGTSQSITPIQNQRVQSQYITTAQPSAYWSGRFVALHDRFASESLNQSSSQRPLEPKDSFTKPSTPDRFPPRSSSLHPAHLSHSITTSALTNVPFPKQRKPPPTDEQSRCRRIFNHLGALCTTQEARRSLHDFQQSYARQCGQPDLLPEGGSMEDKSLMNKIFGGGPRKNERRSLSTLRESSNSKAVRKALAGNPVKSKGKRLTIS